MNQKPPRPIRIPIPGVRRALGAGTAFKSLTTALGVRPCAGCNQRARSLDQRIQLVPFRGRRP